MCPDPWTGKQYGSPNEFDLPRRLLILGESHYGGENGPLANLTNVVINDHIVDGVHMFYNKIRQAILGEFGPSTAEDRRRFWNAVAFYNFVPIPMPAAGVAPEDVQWEIGRQLFLQRLVDLRPTHVVVCGFTTWRNCPEQGFEDVGEELATHLWDLIPYRHRNEERGWVGRYEYEGGSCVIATILHPSYRFTPFNPEDWLRVSAPLSGV